MTIFITIISDTVCPSATSAVPVSPAPSRSTEKQSPADPRRPPLAHLPPGRQTPAESVLVTDVAAKKFGADRPVAQEGFTFTFSGWVGNTRDSHRVIQLGRTKGAEVEDRAAMAAMEMFFKGGAGEQVDSEVEQAHERGYRGVPTFIINDKHG
ncbi:hypothetical protein MANI_012041 [Metarhizium anisopliae]